MSNSSFTRFDITESYEETYSKRWLGLDKIAKLPDDFVIATTEVGYPAAMNKGKTVVDLAGLNERIFAHSKFSSEALFKRYQPDIIYMHPHYKDIIVDLKNNPYFEKHYEYYDLQTLGTELDVAVRVDSKYSKELEDIVENRLKKTP